MGATVSRISLPLALAATSCTALTISAGTDMFIADDGGLLLAPSQELSTIADDRIA